MSTADAVLSPPLPGARSYRRPSLARLTVVELRKMVDTRAGFWLQLSVAAVTVLVVVVTALTGHDQDHTLARFLNNAVQPATVLLPVVGILLVTSEWSQNTTLTTFALVPQRSRVILGKILASLVLSVTAFAVCFVLSLLGTAVSAGGVDGAWHLRVGVGGQALFYLAISMLGGVAFGAAMLSSAPAIVLSFVLPIAWGITSSIVSWLDSAGRWLDAGRTWAPLTDHMLSATEWARLATTTAVWVIVPLAIGLWRILRSEIK